MKLSIIMPVYNEKNTILKILEKVEKIKLPLEKEIVIVDDYSDDGSREILKKVNHKVIFHQKNQGKGSAIKTGLKHITGDLIIIQDADLEYNPEDYKKLIKPILQNKAKIVYGSRFLRKHKAKYQLYYLGNIFLSFIAQLIYGTRITDMETCYKMFKKEVIKDLDIKATGFDFEPEITAKFIKNGYKIIEIPIWYQCRDFEEGKKISWKDGVKAIWYLIKYRFAD